MSKTLKTRVDELEQRGGSGEQVFAIEDDREPLVDGKPWIRISGTDIRMSKEEFERLYPDSTIVIFRLKYDDTNIP